MTLHEARKALRSQWSNAVVIGRRARDAVRSRVIDAALTQTRGNVAHAATLLGMTPTDVRRFCASVHIDIDNYRRTA